MDGRDLILSYKTRQERELDERTVDEEWIEEHSETQLEDSIKRSYTRVSNAEGLTVADAVVEYVSIRNMRHDAWCEYITRCASEPGLNVSDTKVGAFVHALQENTATKMSEVPDSIVNLSPDILYYSLDKGCIFVGDVTVTRSVGFGRTTKSEKYKDVRKYLMSNGCHVVEANFIVSEDGHNAREASIELQNMGLIKFSGRLLTKYCDVNNRCNQIMIMCIDKCPNATDFRIELDKNDKRGTTSDYMPELIKEVADICVDPYIPKRTEEEIMKMIKDEVDKYDPDDYFTNDITKSTDAIDKIIEKNKGQPHAAPKSTLKVIDNSYDRESEVNHGLLFSYVNDLLETEGDPISDYIRYLLPKSGQIGRMKMLYISSGEKNKVDYDLQNKEYRVYGPYQYDFIPLNRPNYLVDNLNSKLVKGKNHRNEKEEVKQIDLTNMGNYFNDVENSMYFYGSPSQKPPVMDDSWDAKTLFESRNSQEIRDIYDYTRSTNGAQLCSSMDHLYERLVHLRTKLSQKVNVVTPPNGSFICVIPPNHAPISSKRVDLPMIYITRFLKDSTGKSSYRSHFEHEYVHNTTRYTYFISKLCRLDIDKIVNWSSSHHKLIAASSYLLHLNSQLLVSKQKVIGLLTYLILDCHQKTSEFLDLMKYVSFMPFSEISRLPELIKDKFDLLQKTKMDAWMLRSMRNFIVALSRVDKSATTKPKLKVSSGIINTETLGVTANLPSFADNNITHSSIGSFIEEITVLYTVRPKHLYGSQFIDASTADTVKWNIEYEAEIERFGGWATDGHDDSSFPFESKFCYSSDIVHYAEVYNQTVTGIMARDVEAALAKSKYNTYIHANCSLRGCTRPYYMRDNASSTHTTSLEAALDYYKSINYDEKECMATMVAQRSIQLGKIQEYSMSEKDQRGGGRPIATPTLGVKAELMMIEKPEAAKGAFAANNIVVPDKSKSREICERYKDALVSGNREHFKKIFQLTEDQTKFSENDNVRKYRAYILTNSTLSADIKKLQLAALARIENRVHLVKRIPRSFADDPAMSRYVVKLAETCGVKSRIGWPQGMLNFISTSVHCAADMWITYAYNKCYPGNKVLTRGLAHSDDSWVAVATNSLDDFKKFVIFRMVAKKMFCLKINQKKLWGSPLMGEMVSNFNLNGNVHLPIGKTIVNSFNNLSYQNWVTDVHNQVSSLQQAYRNGAGLPELIMLATLLRQQLLQQYHVKGEQKRMLYELPVELGGYPSNSVFELGVNGLSSHYYTILNMIQTEPDSQPSRIIKEVLHMSMLDKLTQLNELPVAEKSRTIESMIEAIKKLNTNLESPDGKFNWSDDDYEEIVLPNKSSVFKCIKHIMPKSTKTRLTLEAIRSLPFDDNGLGGLVIRPKTIQEALGHLKGRAMSRAYELAADKYTQSTRRLAINQSIQSSGKILRLLGALPVTFNELYMIMLERSTSGYLPPGALDEAFNDGNDLVVVTSHVVSTAEFTPTNTDKRKIINRMPEIESRFSTIGKLRDVLLRIIDKRTMPTHSYLDLYGDNKVSLETLDNDADVLVSRFPSYFRYYPIIEACTLIFQMSFTVTKSRLWTQPGLRTDNIVVFLCDLYGKTVNQYRNYSVTLSENVTSYKTYNMDLLNSIYNITVLNRINKGKFEMRTINRMKPADALGTIDYSRLDDNNRLKHGVCMHIYTGNMDYLLKAVKDRTYNQHYIRKQRRVGPTWVGDLDIFIKYSGIVLRITGARRRFKIIASSEDIPKIMDAMMQFVNTNFPTDRYQNKSSWGMKDIWRGDPAISDLYLNWWGPTTTIGRSSTSVRIPIRIDSQLAYPAEEIRVHSYNVDYDETLRVIYKVDARNRLYRVANIQQSMVIPLRDQIQLVPAFIDNFINSDLLHYGIMESALLNNPGLIKREDAIRLLDTNGVITNEPIINMFCKLLSIASNRDYDLGERREHLVVHFETESMEPWGCNEFVTTSETTEPEDLECIEEEYAGYTERKGSIKIPIDITKLLCKTISGEVTRYRANTFIHRLLHHPKLVRWLSKQFEEGLGISDYEEMLQSGLCCSVTPPDVFALITLAELDVNSGWDDIDMSIMDDHTWEREKSEYVKRLVEEFLVCINDNLFNYADTRESVVSLLRSRPQ